MQEGQGQWLCESDGTSLYFPISPMSSKMNSTIEPETRNVMPIPSEKVSTDSQDVWDNAPNIGLPEDIDSTRKPVQKLKRKNHRPKVINEGQSLRQKSTAPEPPKENVIHPSGKRKYVRKIGQNTSMKQLPEEVTERNNRVEPRLARELLNFDEKDRQESMDVFSQVLVTGTPCLGDHQSSTSAVEATAQVSCHWGGPSSSAKPSNIIQDLQADTMQNREMCDLNNSINQMPGNGTNHMDSYGQFCQLDSGDIYSLPRNRQPLVSVVEGIHAQSSFHCGSTSNSISFSLDPLVTLEDPKGDAMPKTENCDFNISINQMPRKHTHYTHNFGRLFQSGLKETVQKNHTQNRSTYFSQYLCMPQSSRDKHLRSEQMLSGYMMPENPVAPPIRASTKEEFISDVCIIESLIANQMYQGYNVPKSPIAPPSCSEKDAMNGNQYGLFVENGYLKLGKCIQDDFGHYGPPCFSDGVTVSRKREYDVTTGPQISLGMNSDCLNNARLFCNDPRSSSSQASYYPGVLKRVRSDNHRNRLNCAVGKFSSSSAYLPSYWNTHKSPMIYSGIGTQDEQRQSLPLQKSLASHQMTSFGMSEHNTVQQHSKPMLYDMNGKIFTASPDRQFRHFTVNHTQLPESSMNPLGENNIQKNGIDQLQVRSAPQDCIDFIASANKQFTYPIAEDIQWSSGIVNPYTEQFVPSNGLHQVQFSENHVASWVDLFSKSHNTATVDDYCIAMPCEHRAEVVRSPILPMSQSTGTANCHLQVSRENTAANSTKKPKVRGCPRKHVEPSGKPKVRGTQGRQGVAHAGLFEIEDIYSGSEPSRVKTIRMEAGSEPSRVKTTGMAAIDHERNRKRISSAFETSDHGRYGNLSNTWTPGGGNSKYIAPAVDPLDIMIQKLKCLNINKADEIVSAMPTNEVDALVLFDRNVKKKNPQPKMNIVIDPVTNLAWNLLMKKDMSDGAEGMDKDKENWLNEERRIFRGRIDSFIARMHRVQGDRRFSPWKGSVVDSVVGVYLTQNVTDVLSSKTFMELAAKFPVKSEGPEEPAADGSCRRPEQKDSCSGLFGDSIKLQGKFFVEEITDTRSLNTKEDSEWSNSNKLTGRSSRGGVKLLTGFHENKTLRSANPAVNIASLLKAEFADVNLSQNSSAAFLNPVGASCFPKSKTKAPFVEQCVCSNLEVHPTITRQMGSFQTRCSQWNNATSRCKIQNSHSEIPQSVSSDSVGISKDTHMGPMEVRSSKLKANKGQPKRKAYDWDNLRKEVLCNGGNKQKGYGAKDTVDWEALRQANQNVIADTIRERGLNNKLARYIQSFLNRLVKDHGSIDLEWLRNVQPGKAKDYLLSIEGLGLKCTECIRLLTLHHAAFPVDINVSRICVRLGWVPLQPLPGSLQLHLLEEYPVLDQVQKYIWPRLCKLDQPTLYELHYQMITFGKVFCTKKDPNCISCPMRTECKHFASAFPSASLALPGSEEKGTSKDLRPEGRLEWNADHSEHVVGVNHQPIIEEPASPEHEPESAGTKQDVAEDLFSEDPDEIPTINLNVEDFTQNLRSCMQAHNTEIRDVEMSKALVAVTPEVNAIPAPKLKNVSRLRTKHQVYELPDSHPLLEGFDRRQQDDPCPYLLAIWTPGETTQSTDAPKASCNSNETDILCESSTCFSCNNIREIHAQKVRGTLLIPCRTAMRGSFPLNGTHFQVNEVFADHYTSYNPIDVRRGLIWHLPRRTIYFGTSITTIFKGLTSEEIQVCFWGGFVCVRGFDRITRVPKPLCPRLHLSASKVSRAKTDASTAEASMKKRKMNKKDV